jgi:hypothetical protein
MLAGCSMDAKPTTSQPLEDVFLLSEAAAKLGLEVEEEGDSEHGVADDDDDASVRHPPEQPS